MVPPLDPMTSSVKVIWPDGHTCIIGPWVGAGAGIALGLACCPSCGSELPEPASRCLAGPQCQATFGTAEPGEATMSDWVPSTCMVHVSFPKNIFHCRRYCRNRKTCLQLTFVNCWLRPFSTLTSHASYFKRWKSTLNHRQRPVMDGFHYRFSSGIFSSDIFSSTFFRPHVFVHALFRRANFRLAFFRTRTISSRIFSSRHFGSEWFSDGGYSPLSS